ncbi:hypothetical protein Bca52824_097055 [Brassica carinata]|uniref:Uncharacterized protein n=1 Tax=Brassica carinata TaxID=52824 RepID=A0A8X7NWV8_BRACI|nr:hypothetical protein Bca52824_097055 [Brassica carinata]
MQKMGESKGYGKGGRVIPNVMSSYNVSLQLSPVVSFWDCIVRTMSMDHAVCKQVQPLARKGKKKHNGKDEFDRVKQAEKKKRRLEKALANSAAIRAELEKKKQRKLEEQQRLDEEGAAIAEAVALHVLLGEDSDDSSRVMLGQEKGCFKMDLFRGENYVPRQSCASYAVQGIGNWSPFMRESWDSNMGVSADLIAAQAVSSLRISENTDRNAFVLKGMFRDDKSP